MYDGFLKSYSFFETSFLTSSADPLPPVGYFYWKGGVDMLTPKQEAFCMAYVRTNNATKSYLEAGYKAKNANTAAASSSALLRQPNIALRLSEIRKTIHDKQAETLAEKTAEIKAKNIMDIAEMQERLSAVARQEATEEYISSSGETMERKVSMKDALKAMELLGKMQGAFLDRQQVEMSGAVPVVIKDDVKA